MKYIIGWIVATLLLCGSCKVNQEIHEFDLQSIQADKIMLESGESIPLDWNEVKKVYYLVRHAEKLKDGSKNPMLTPEGEQRAESIKRIFAKGELDKAFVTMTNRTIKTADAVIRSKDLVMNTYDGKKLEEFAKKLEMDNRFKTVLIVGHSNTTPALAKLLSGKNDVASIPESVYDRFIVVIEKENSKEVYTLKY